jgi:hypothetical protein
MARYKVIANPTAGGGAGARAIPQIERLLAKHGLDFDVVCTERPWHAAETARGRPSLQDMTSSSQRVADAPVSASASRHQLRLRK